MSDPHVESLTYRLETGKTLEFEDPPPLEEENDALRLRLAEGVLTVWPKDHYACKETVLSASIWKACLAESVSSSLA